MYKNLNGLEGSVAAFKLLKSFVVLNVCSTPNKAGFIVVRERVDLFAITYRSKAFLLFGSSADVMPKSNRVAHCLSRTRS